MSAPILSCLYNAFHCPPLLLFLPCPDQSGKSNSDDIYDILEDEQLFIVDKKLSKSAYKSQMPKTAVNSSVLSPKPGAAASSSSSISSGTSILNSDHAAAAAVATSTPKPRTTAGPGMQYTGYTTHASAGHVETVEQELVGDFLIFSQEQEEMELAEEQRREEERELARRVKRQVQVPEGSGVNNGKICRRRPSRCCRRCCCQFCW